MKLNTLNKNVSVHSLYIHAETTRKIEISQNQNRRVINIYSILSIQRQQTQLHIFFKQTKRWQVAKNVA